MDDDSGFQIVLISTFVRETQSSYATHPLHFLVGDFIKW